MVSLIKYGALGGGEKYETNVMTFDGLSSDDLPVGTFEGMAIPNGSSYCETDTGVKYLYDEENEEWYEQPSGGGGGGGGTDNYNDLSNKPKINGVTLTGDKSLSALDAVSNTTFEEFLDALESYLENEVQSKITSQNRLSADLVEEENDKYFASEDELNKIDAILDGQDYFDDATALSSGDDLDTLDIGKYRAENSVVDNISHTPTDNAFVLFVIKTTNNYYMQIAYVISSVNYYIRHGGIVNGVKVWLPWQVYNTQIDASHKLSSDYVTDTDKTNKFVTAAEKTAIATIGDKVDKVEGRGLSTNDYTTAEKTKLGDLTQYTDADAVEVSYGIGTNITKNSDLNDYTTPGTYHCTGASVGNTLSNSPTANPYRLEVKNFTSSSNYVQEITTINNTTDGLPEVYRRVKLSSGWKAWQKFEPTIQPTNSLSASPTIIGNDITI